MLAMHILRYTTIIYLKSFKYKCYDVLSNHKIKNDEYLTICISRAKSSFYKS